MLNTHPHENTTVFQTGLELYEAKAAMILIHGRGGGAQSILPLLTHINVQGYAFFAPSAQDNTWYPERFIAPREQNEPFLSSALRKVDSVVNTILEGGVSAQRIMLLGFSQGGCLALEYVARYPRRYGGAVALSGGLIGAEGELVGYQPELDGTPIYLGCSDVDSHIPIARVHESASILEEMGGRVKKQIFPGLGHTINTVEMAITRKMMENVLT